MKIVTYWICFCFYLLASGYTFTEEKKESSEFPLEQLISSPLPISQDLPITLSAHNKQTYIDNEEVEKSELNNIKAVIKSKQIPWISIIALTAVLLIYFMIKNSPEPFRYRISKQNEIPKWKQAIDILNRVSANKTQGSYDVRISQIDHALRLFYEDKYNLTSPPDTTPEFLAHVNKSPLVTSTHRELLVKFLKKAELVEYGRRPLTDEEYQDVLKIAKELLKD